MFILYDILLHFSLILFLPYFLFKMVVIGKYRTGILERFGFIHEEKLGNLTGASVVWFHAVSVGETKAVLPLVKRLKEAHPDNRVVFSTVTTTGNAIARKEGAPLIDTLIYFPLDLSWVVKRVVKQINPKVLVVVEKEIWPNMVKALRQKEIPIVVVNGRISDRSYKRYKFFSFFFKHIFGSISSFLCQAKQDCYKVVTLGLDAERVFLTGSIKFDLEPPEWDSAERVSLLQLLNIIDNDKIIVAGSTHAGEEEIILDVFQRLKREFSDLILILAPRHPERFDEVERLVLDKGFSLMRRSAIEGQSEGSDFFNRKSEIPNPKSEVILLDTMGELSKFYSLATVAFVGGSLADIGGHNLLEPAMYKKPVLYGPHIKSCLEMAKMLEKEGGGIRVEHGDELYDKIKELLLDDTRRQNAGIAGYNVIEANRGATEKSLRVVESYLQ